MCSISNQCRTATPHPDNALPHQEEGVSNYAKDRHSVFTGGGSIGEPGLVIGGRFWLWGFDGRRCVCDLHPTHGGLPITLCVEGDRSGMDGSTRDAGGAPRCPPMQCTPSFENMMSRSSSSLHLRSLVGRLSPYFRPLPNRNWTQIT